MSFVPCIEFLNFAAVFNARSRECIGEDVLVSLREKHAAQATRMQENKKSVEKRVVWFV